MADQVPDADKGKRLRKNIGPPILFEHVRAKFQRKVRKEIGFEFEYQKLFSFLKFIRY